MKHTRFAQSGAVLPGAAWLCLAAIALLVPGCTPLPGWDGIFSIDKTGGAKTCVAPAASPGNDQAVLVQMQVSNDGGWCGIIANHSGVAYDSYLMAVRPTHGTVFAHHVGANTRIDYTPDPGFAGADKFAIRLIPGNAEIQAAVTVTK
jgi:hypothetical protein